MPSSTPIHIPYMLELMKKITESPKKILDVGIGFGKWGYLIREYYEVLWNQRFTKQDWKIRIEGIEIFPKYICEVQKIIYDKIFQKDVFSVFQKLRQYNFIILGDVLEHFEKNRGYLLIDRLFEHTNDIIIATPNGYVPQDNWGGNVSETHKSGWTIDDFEKYNVIEYKTLKDNLFESSIPILVLHLKK